MYVGRIVAIGMNKKGNVVGMYRVSSRSFSNRKTCLLDGKISVIPKAGFESDLAKNPYISYNCLKIADKYAVISNGSHTDPIAEKILMGYPPRDALALSLIAMDYEKDFYNTPRIAGVINRDSNIAHLATVTQKALLVKDFELTPGVAYYVATYEHYNPCEKYKDVDFDVDSALEARKYVNNRGVFTTLDLPVTSAAVFASESKFELSAEN